MKTGEKIWKIAAVIVSGVLSLKIGSIFEDAQAGGVAIGGVAVYILPVVVIISLSMCLRMGGRMRISEKGWNEVFSKGWYILAVSAVLAYLALSSPMQGEPLPGIPLRAFILAAGCLLTAVFEEIWFRGLVQGILLDGTEMNGKSAWRAICAASGLFAAVHLLNLIEKPEYVIGTMVQVLYTFSLGLMLGTIFYLCGNIWVCVLLHAVFNFCGTVTDIFVETPPQSGDMAAGAAALLLILLMPGIVWAWVMYKKALNKEAPDSFVRDERV